MSEWFTPPQVARARKLRVSKVLYWISTGEILAVNHARDRLGRPRWRISAAALEAFDRTRSNRTLTTPNAPRRVRPGEQAVVEFF
jgi:hypothetical protein